MAPKLYIYSGSPPSRAVIITAKAIGLSIKIQEVDAEAGELYSSEFLKINPQHTVPILDDDGFIIWDSHAIIPYLVEKYAKDDSFYPKDLQKRALINQRLHFDSGTLFPLIKSVVVAFKKNGSETELGDKLDEIKGAYDFLEKFLDGKQWIGGDKVSIADFSCLTSVTSLNVLMAADPRTYPNTNNWIKRVKAFPYCVRDQDRLEDFKIFIAKISSQ